MCDIPMVGVFTTHETHRSWIMIKKRKTTTGTVQAGIQSTTERFHPDLNDMCVLVDSLDPHLRPATPDYSNPRSVEIYEEHKQLAEEYWKVQTELVLMQQKKNQLLAAQAEEEHRQKFLKALKEEAESLRLARDLLQQQKARSADGEDGNARNSGDGWVIVPRQNERMN